MDRRVGCRGPVLQLGNGSADQVSGELESDFLTDGGGDDSTCLTRQDRGKALTRRDRIVDFESGVEQIDLSATDGRRNGTINDVFIWFDTDAFGYVEADLVF